MLDHNSKNNASERLRASRRVVIKLGTSIVTGADGQICTEQVEPIVRSIAALKSAGRQVVLVSSGAVGLGAGRLNLARARLNDLVVRQACAAVGQNLLMNAYERLFSALDVQIAQVLLTEKDFADRRSYRNLRSTMEKLLKFGVLPIVNENDTVSTAELEYLSDSADRHARGRCRGNRQRHDARYARSYLRRSGCRHNLRLIIAHARQETMDRLRCQCSGARDSKRRRPRRYPGRQRQSIGFWRHSGRGRF